MLYTLTIRQDRYYQLPIATLKDARFTGSW
nr:MAG TPA: hypothetical protein [Caudoviricetes sp.]